MKVPGSRAAAALLRAWLACLLLAACAASVRVQPAQLTPLSAASPDLVIASEVPILLSTGYTRTVPPSRWRAVGALPEGTVFRPLDTVFAIEGRNVHEAYLVVRSGAVSGFYLPGEGNFSPLSPPVSLPLATGAQR
jgi:hypothetical protein